MQVTPAIFRYKGKELMIDAGKECRVYLMDIESIGGDDRTPLYRTPLICNEEVNFAWRASGSMASRRTPGERAALTPFWGPKHSRLARRLNTARSISANHRL
jgi:hypothetical protein